MYYLSRYVIYDCYSLCIISSLLNDPLIHVKNSEIYREVRVSLIHISGLEADLMLTQ
jgi:hypothetical protein